MTRRERKEQLRAQKQALRASMKALRQKARAELAANPVVQRARRRRQLRRAVGLGVVALLLLLVRCECAVVPPPPPEPVPVVEKPEQKKEPPAPKPKKKPKPKPMEAKVAPQPRSTYEAPPPVAPPWLEEFRIQVAARSPRLAQCFEGTDRPGALRWSTAVNASSGKVSGHELVPMREGAALDNKQRDCVINVLSNPKYLISTWDDGDKAVPSRVSIVIEF